MFKYLRNEKNSRREERHPLLFFCARCIHKNLWTAKSDCFLKHNSSQSGRTDLRSTFAVITYQLAKALFFLLYMGKVSWNCNIRNEAQARQFFRFWMTAQAPIMINNSGFGFVKVFFVKCTIITCICFKHCYISLYIISLITIYRY